MPNVRILTTGGTIDKVYYDAESTYAVGEPQVVDILRAAGVTLSVTAQHLFRKDSLELTDEDRAHILQAVREAPETRILITHGTDTMVQTAKTLSAVQDKTIVLVGSLSPARFKQTDAEFNVGFAFAAVQTLPPGVYIAMNGQVFRPDGVRKNRSANRFEAL